LDFFVKLFYSIDFWCGGQLQLTKSWYMIPKHLDTIKSIDFLLQIRSQSKNKMKMKIIFFALLLLSSPFFSMAGCSVARTENQNIAQFVPKIAQNVATKK
jgi:hypothetical protein